MAAVTKPKVERIRPAGLVRLALTGRLRVPPFQRPFRWETTDVVNLFDSILRGYPIGNLLMWSRPASATMVSFGPLVVDAPEVSEALWVVDGQQRVTSLAGALAGPPDTRDPRFRIYFDLGRGQFISGGSGERVRDTWLPVSVALDNTRLLPWQRERSWLTDEQIRQCDEVATALRDYEIPMYVVEGDDEQALREIFDRLNNFGKRLKKSEVFQALHAVADQRQPSDLAALADGVRGFGFGEFSPDVLMQSLLAGRDPRVDRDFHEEFKGDDDKHAAFVDTERALGDVVEFLRWKASIPHARLLPYILFVPVLARFVMLFGPPSGRPAQLLRRWIWRGSALGLPGGPPALRRHTAAVAEDPLESTQRLLELLPPPRGPWEPDLAQVHLNRAQTKVNVLGMLGANPRILVPGDGDDGLERGDLIDPADLAASSTSPLVEILPVEREAHPLAGTLANRTIHPVRRTGTIWGALAATEDPDLLAGHCLDIECVRLLRRGDKVGFLERRAHILGDQISSHVQRHALFGFRDGPPLSALFEGPGDVYAA